MSRICTQAVFQIRCYPTVRSASTVLWQSHATKTRTAWHPMGLSTTVSVLAKSHTTVNVPQRLASCSRIHCKEAQNASRSRAGPAPTQLRERTVQVSRLIRKMATSTSSFASTVTIMRLSVSSAKSMEKSMIKTNWRLENRPNKKDNHQKISML